jgi:hypothetical protein
VTINRDETGLVRAKFSIPEIEGRPGKKAMLCGLKEYPFAMMLRYQALSQPRNRYSPLDA